MNKSAIIISGYLAAGKSVFALRLSKAIEVPYFMKDTFKTAICSSMPMWSAEESSRFSAVTFDAMLYAAERLFEVGHPVILEGNFVPAGVKSVDEAGAIQKLIEKYGYQSITYHFTGDTKILYQRFLEREKSPERGQANRMLWKLSYADFDRFCHNLDDFSIGGETVRMDTSDFQKVDFDAQIERARLFLNSAKSANRKPMDASSSNHG